MEELSRMRQEYEDGILDEQLMEQRFEGRKVPRPPHWGGFLIRPSVIEFWQGQADRLHDRIVYYKTKDGWSKHRLAP